MGSDPLPVFRLEKHDKVVRLLGIPALGPEVRDAWMDFMAEIGSDRRALREALRHCRMGEYAEAERILAEQVDTLAPPSCAS